MTPERARQLLDNLKDASVAVVGDFCLDVYWTLDDARSEISVETGLPTRPVREHRYTPGGAGNIVSNLRAMGCREVYAVGIVGDDPWGRELRRLLDAAGVDGSGMVVQSDCFHTLSYVKPHSLGFEESRFDFGDFNRVDPVTVDRVVSHLESLLDRVGSVAVNQQVPEGAHSPEMREALSALMRRHQDKVFIVDSRDYSDCYYGGWLKLNERELRTLLGPDGPSGLEAAEVVFDKTQRPVFVTLGERGCVVRHSGGLDVVPGVVIEGEKDLVGAGDAFVAGAAAGVAAGGTPGECAWMGVLAASVTVGKVRQTGTASADEIMQLVRTAKWRA